MNFDEIMERVSENEGEQVAICCDTEEKAIDLLSRLHGKGYKWYSGLPIDSGNKWYFYEEETCYILTGDNNVVYGVNDEKKFVKYEITNK